MSTTGRGISGVLPGGQAQDEEYARPISSHRLRTRGKPELKLALRDAQLGRVLGLAKSYNELA